ncbi:MAG: tetratricopeptide repeat protein [Acidobacteriota bacterium]
MIVRAWKLAALHGTITPMSMPFTTRTSAATAVLLLLGGFTASHATEADESPWRDQFARSRTLYDAGQFEDAEKSLTAFVKGTERLGLPDLEFAEALTKAGSLYLGLGRFAEGTRHLERSLALWDRLPGVRHPGPLWAANSLVTVYTETQQLNRAQKLAERTLQRRQELLDLYPLERAHTLHDLATVYQLRGKHREAESFLRTSVALMEQYGSADDERIMHVLVTLAPVLVRTGQPESALACIQRARLIGEKRFGRDHMVLGRVLIAESLVYRSLNRTPDALVAIEKALAIVPAYMEPLQQAALDEYARVLRQKGEKRNAETAETRAAEIRERIGAASRHTVDIKALTRDRDR